MMLCRFVFRLSHPVHQHFYTLTALFKIFRTSIAFWGHNRLKDGSNEDMQQYYIMQRMNQHNAKLLFYLIVYPISNFFSDLVKSIQRL